MFDLNRGVDIYRYFGFKRASRDARPERLAGDRGEPVGPHRLRDEVKPGPELKKRLRALGIVKRHGRWVRA